MAVDTVSKEDQGLLWPAAKGPQGEVALARLATDRSIVYRCLGCDQPLILRRGEYKRPHFAHRHGQECHIPAGESVEHITAKNLLAQHVQVNGQLSFVVYYPHHLVGSLKGTNEPGWYHVVSLSNVKAKMEYRFPNGRIGDVVLLDAGTGTPVLDVEILHSHKVDADKAYDLADSGIPWVEVHANVVLTLDLVKPLKTNRSVIPEELCQECRQDVESKVRELTYSINYFRNELRTANRLVSHPLFEHVSRSIFISAGGRDYLVPLVPLPKNISSDEARAFITELSSFGLGAVSEFKLGLRVDMVVPTQLSQELADGTKQSTITKEIDRLSRQKDQLVRKLQGSNQEKGD